MLTADFQFPLPPELIAQHPTARREDSRLLVLHRQDGHCAHHRFPDFITELRPGDLLVLNNSKVIPARLRGVNANSSGQFEILLLEENAPNDWWVMLKPGKRARVGTTIQLVATKPAPSNILATVIATNAEGHRRLQFTGCADLRSVLDRLGEVPLPPYIRRTPGGGDRETAEAQSREDRERYQTVYAQPPGSIAAPTAGLHFTAGLLEAIRARGVEICFVTLHVGLGTFAPVKVEVLTDHVMHEERYEVPAATASRVNAAKREGRRVVAVGTTSVRVLESAAQSVAEPEGSPARFEISAGAGRTRIFIHPPYAFKCVDALLTNFHLPSSTLLMLVSAFATPGETRGRDVILAAYAEAIRECYRFFSYGDAMLIL